jgi:isoquinoline 1-oxidoreductase beta subunit
VAAKAHKVINLKNGKELGFGELAKAASALPVPNPETIRLKPKSEYTIIGQDVALQGLENIVRAKAVYAHDIQLPGMLIASIERPPVVGGKVASFDATDAKKIKGVVDVIQLKDRSYPVQVFPKSGVAVLATNTWAAIEGRKKLKVEWDHGENQSHDSDLYKKDLVEKVNKKAKQIRVVGDVYAHQFDPKKTVEATYTVPYHHHMSMETPAATAYVEAEKTTVWTGTQAPQWGKTLVMQELGMDPKTDQGKVDFNTTLMGGAFGRNSTKE